MQPLIEEAEFLERKVVAHRTVLTRQRENKAYLKQHNIQPWTISNSEMSTGDARGTVLHINKMKRELAVLQKVVEERPQVVALLKPLQLQALNDQSLEAVGGRQKYIEMLKRTLVHEERVLKEELARHRRIQWSQRYGRR